MLVTGCKIATRYQTMVTRRLNEKSIRTQHVLLGATVFGMVKSASVFAQGRFKTVGLKNINRQPCDLKASQDACEIGFFRGNPDKDENCSIIRAKKREVPTARFSLNPEKADNPSID